MRHINSNWWKAVLLIAVSANFLTQANATSHVSTADPEDKLIEVMYTKATRIPVKAKTLTR